MTYDSKTLIEPAHRHATGEPLAPASFSEGARPLMRLTALGLGFRGHLRVAQSVQRQPLQPVLSGWVSVSSPSVSSVLSNTSGIRNQGCDWPPHRTELLGSTDNAWLALSDYLM
jgi:hypothetical protein